MGISAAAKMQRYRERQRADQVCLTITVDHFGLADLLIAAGLLQQTDDENRPAIEAATEKLIATMIRERTQ